MATLNLRVDPTQMVMGAQQGEDALQDVAHQAQRTQSAVDGMARNIGRGAGLAGHKMKQLAQQGSQVVDMGLATGQWGKAFFLQMSDIAMVLGGPLTIAAGAAIGVLGTVGLSFLNIGGDAEKFSDALEVIDDTAEALSGSLDLLRMDAESLGDTYGAAADRIREFAIAQAEINVDQATRRLSEQVSMLGDLADKYRFVEGEMSLFGMSESRIFDDFGVQGDNARMLSQALADLGAAVGPDMQAEGLQEVFDLLEDMDIPLSDIPEDLKLAINEMITLGAETARVEELMRQLSIEASSIKVGIGAFGGPGRVIPLQPKDPPKTRTRRGGGGANSAARDAERASDAFDRLVASMDPAAAAALRLSNAQEVVNEALEQGVITADQAATAYDQIETTLGAQTDLFDSLADVGGSALDRLIDGSGDLKEALVDVAKQMLQVILKQQLMAKIGVGSSGGGGVGSMLLQGLFGGFFDNGGLLSTGQTGIVGENGPERITSTTRGTVVTSRAQTARQGGSSGGGVVMGNIGVTVDDSGKIQAFVKSMGIQAAQAGRALAVGDVRDNLGSWNQTLNTDGALS